MARLVVKVKYLKPNGKRTPGRYARYIGTREGVDKIDDSSKFHEPRERDTTYADYIATRPRAEKIGKHGLFTDAGVEVDLDKVSDELNNFKGTIWTVIVSIKRDDAETLGFDTGERWRNMVRAGRDEIAKNFRIRPSSLRWYGAFHNESYHPHIHLIVYDTENRGYIDKTGIENLKSTFAHVIFQDEMLHLQNEKTERRDKLRLRGKDEIEAIIKRINDGQESDYVLQSMLLDLNSRLKKHDGKKVYGYLKKSDKYLVDRIIDRIEKILAVKELYDLWYEKHEVLHRIYSENTPVRMPLSKNPAFKTIRNAVISAADEIDESLIRSRPDFDNEDDIVGIDVSEEEPWIVHEDRKRHSTDQEIQDNTSYSPEHPNNTRDTAGYRTSDPDYMTTTVTRLLNHVSRIFRDQFNDNPDHVPKVDIKLWRQIEEKKQAHGLKHG